MLVSFLPQPCSREKAILKLSAFCSVIDRVIVIKARIGQGADVLDIFCMSSLSSSSLSDYAHSLPLCWDGKLRKINIDTSKQTLHRRAAKCRTSDNFWLAEDEMAS